MNKRIKRQEILSSREEFKGSRKFGFAAFIENQLKQSTFPALRDDDVIWTEPSTNLSRAVSSWRTLKHRMIFTVCQSSLWRRNITITLVYNFISLNSCCYTFFSCFIIVSTANYGFNWNNRKHRNSRYKTFGAFLLWKLWRIFFPNFQNRDIPPRKAAMDRNLVKKLSILSPLTNYYNSKETGTLLWTKHDAFFFQFTFLTARWRWARFSKWVAPFSFGSAFLSITRTVQRCSGPLVLPLTQILACCG